MLCGFESARWQVQEEQKVYGPLKRQFERISAASGNAPANAYRLKIARVVKTWFG